MGDVIMCFTQESAYEIRHSLVGSEMCISDGPSYLYRNTYTEIKHIYWVLSVFLYTDGFSFEGWLGGLGFFW